LDLRVVGPEEMSRDELVVVVRRQAGQIAAQAGQLAELMACQRGAGREAGPAGASALAQLGQLLEPALA
jgi:hypothetical protein